MASKTFTFAEVRGQEKAKRAMEIAAAGGHHLALVGPRGCGKSALVAAYSNYASSVWDSALGRPAPKVVAPATNATPGDLGGGDRDADLIGRLDGGLLVLDDIDLFRSETLATVRACIDAGAIEPPKGSDEPRMFQLVASLSVCPCGYGTVGFSPCGDGRGCLVRHQWGALRWFLDVLDLQVVLENTTPSDWGGRQDGSELSAECIAKAKHQQEQRGVRNVDLDGELLRQACVLEKDTAALFDQAIQYQEMTGRDCAAALRVARTLADMNASTTVRRIHMAEALIYRLPRPLFSHYLNHQIYDVALS